MWASPIRQLRAPVSVLRDDGDDLPGLRGEVHLHAGEALDLADKKSFADAVPIRWATSPIGASSWTSWSGIRPLRRTCPRPPWQGSQKIVAFRYRRHHGSYPYQQLVDHRDGCGRFCAWSGPYLQKFSKTVDHTEAGDNG